MSRRAGSRRLGSSRPRHIPTLDELAVADGVDVEDLLREVSEFRLALDTDLTIAAAAADAVADHVAPAEFSSELTDQALDAGRTALDELVTRTRRTGARRRPAGRRLRGVPLIGVGPLVGVAIVLGLGSGFFASNLHASTQSRGLTNAADTSLHSLSSALGDGNEQAAREAGNQLSAAIGSLIAAAPGNPAAAQAAASALTAEQSLLANTSGALGAQLRASMTAQVMALQTTVHTPLATLVAPSTRPTTATLPHPVTLPSRLLPTVTQIVVPSLVARLAPSHHLSSSHDPDPIPSLIGLLIPPTAEPSAAAYPAAGTTATPVPTSTSPSAFSSPSASSTASPTATASMSPPAGPLSFSTASVNGQSYLPH